jgi:hypothetical protein
MGQLTDAFYANLSRQIKSLPWSDLKPANYGLARNIAWKDTPDNQILAAAMKVK